MIQCKDLKKSYGENEVLKEVSFTIGEGQIFGLLGPSGAGKTTLIKILTGQLAYDAGTVMVMGKEPGRLNGKEKRCFGIMMDSFGVYERFSCGENLAVFADLYGIPIAFIAYYPALVLLRPDEIPVLSYISPFLGIMFFWLSYKFWMLGARKYNGTGS